MRYDAIIVGAGHNGLTAALCLAKTGRKPLLLERRDRVGGLCGLDEFHPGYHAPGPLYETVFFREALARRLGLANHGLKLEDESRPTLAFSTDSATVEICRNSQGKAALQGVSSSDVEAYGRWREFVSRIQSFVESIFNQPPPPLSAKSVSNIWSLARKGISLRRLGRDDLLELTRVAPMCVADWLNEYFETPLLCEALAAPAVMGGFVGPWAAGTAANLLVRECTAGKSVVGGAPALIAALTGACESAGVEIRTNSPVRRIRVSSGAVAGVALESGEELASAAVAASCDPKTTFLRLIRPADLPMRVEGVFRSVRARGSLAKVHLALKAPLRFKGRMASDFDAVLFCGGHLDELEKSFDALKYRKVSDRPVLEVRAFGENCPGMAPSGCEAVSALVNCAPYDLEGGWTTEARSQLAQKVLDILASQAPGIKTELAACEVLAPPDLEERYGVNEGNIHHVEHALDQLLCMRPTPCASNYATPIRGLFLAGGGSHPGGGVTGMPGALAAEAMLDAGS